MACSGQKPVSIDEHACDDGPTEQAVAVIGGDNLEAQQAAIEVVESGRHSHRLTDRRPQQVLELDAGSHGRAAVREPSIGQGRDTGCLSEREKTWRRKDGDVSAADGRQPCRRR